MKEKDIFEGYLSIPRNRQPMLWQIPFDRSYDFYEFPELFIAKYELRNGVRIKCQLNRKSIQSIISICDLKPDEFIFRPEFTKLLPVNPNEKFDFGASASLSLRILDLITPIGKGTRGIIVSPPRAGKTMLLEKLTNELHRLDPNLKIIVLLIDERPEEITSFKLNTKAVVFASSLDSVISSHTALAGFLLDNIRLELECGNEIVILIDSLTRIGRAFNLNDNRHNNRTMSGGLNSGALLFPRKLFGYARNINQGGSCTILATILKDTGSRMDEHIFQEFVGTGNCEIILDREIAEARIFPALDIVKSGTRKEELFYTDAEMIKLQELHRKLTLMDKAAAINYLKALLPNFKSNKDLLAENIV